MAISHLSVTGQLEFLHQVFVNRHKNKQNQVQIGTVALLYIVFLNQNLFFVPVHPSFVTLSMIWMEFKKESVPKSLIQNVLWLQYLKILLLHVLLKMGTGH